MPLRRLVYVRGLNGRRLLGDDGLPNEKQTYGVTVIDVDLLNRATVRDRKAVLGLEALADYLDDWDAVVFQSIDLTVEEVAWLKDNGYWTRWPWGGYRGQHLIRGLFADHVLPEDY